MRTTIRLAAVAAVTASIGVALSAAPAAAEQVGTDDVKLTTGVDPRDVQVAYDPVNDRHLIVWDDGVSPAPELIRGQVVNATGGVVAGPFTIGQSPVGGFVGEPAVTWNSGANQWMVAFASDDTLAGEREIYVNTVSAAGSPGAQFRVSDLGDDTVLFDAQQPDIVYNASSAETLVVWRGDDTVPADGEDEIWGQRLSGTAEVGINDFRISAVGTDGNTLTDARAPQVAWNSATNTYGVVFEQLDSLLPVAVWAQLLSSSGSSAGAATQLATGSAGVTEPGRATIAADDVGTGFLAAWEVFTVASATGAIAGRTIAAGPSLGPVLNLSTPGVDSLAPDLAYNTTADRYGLVFHADALAGAGTEYEIYGTLLTTAGAVAETLERLSTMGTDGVASTVTINAAVSQAAGGRMLAVWQSDDTAAGDTEVYGQLYQVNVPPTVTINQAAGQPDPTNASPVSFTVVFSEPVVGFTNADISTTGSTATVGAIAISGSGPTYTVTVAVSGNGTVTASIPASAVTDIGGLSNSASTSTDNTVTIDTVAPTVTVNQAVGQVDPTNSGTVDFTAVFSEPVTGFTVGDVSLAGSTATGGTVSILGAGPTYTVRVSGVTGGGTVVVSIPASGATDAAGNGNAVSTSTDNTVTVDLSNPSVTIEQASGQSDPTNTGPIDFTATFSEAVIGFAGGDVVLSASGAAGPLSATVTGSGPVYNVSVSGMTGDGTVIASIVAGAATDTAGNPSTVSTSTDNTVLYDAAAPTVTVAPISPDPTNANPVQFSVAFSEAVSGFTSGDVDFTGSTAGGTLAATVGAPTGNTYPVTVTGMTSPGEVAVSIGASTVLDLAGNPNSASNTVSITWENVAPTVTVDQAVGQADPTNNAAIAFTVIASEPLTGLVAADFSVSNGTPTAVTPTAVSGVYDLIVTASAPGPVTASLAAGLATDAAGNGNLASTSSDNSVTYDPTAPTVTVNQAAGQVDPTNVASITFDVVFSEPVTGFGDAPGDVDLSESTATGALSASVSGSGTTYVVTVTGMTGSGDVVAKITVGAGTDTAGNDNVASTSTDNTVRFDIDNPTVGVGRAVGQPSPTNASPINFIVDFSEPVTGFGPTDISFAGSTTGGTLVAVVGAPTGTTYPVSVTGMAGSGLVRLSVPAGAATDAAGNLTTASGEASVTWDVDAPTVAIDQAVGQADPTAAQPIVFTAAFSEPIPVFPAGAVSFAGSTAPGAYSVAISGQGTSTITISVSGITGSGTVIASIPAGAVTDAAGNPNAASTSTDNEVASTVPSFSLEPASLDFGDVPLTASRTLDVLVRNTTGAPITVSMAGGGLSSPPGNFGNAQNCQGNTLAANATCTISYTFQPQSLGAKAITNSFQLNGEPYQVALSGTGVSGLTPSTTSLDFGSLPAGSTSAPQQVVFTNSSTFTISNIQMAGGGLGGPTSDYSNSQNCQGATLTPGQTCSVQYQFHPRSVGAKSITNTFTLNTAPVAIDLTGVGTSPVTVTPADLTFAARLGGTTSAPQTITVTNTSAATLPALDVTNLAAADPVNFGVTDHCDGVDLAPAGTCTIDVVFHPTAIGSLSSTVSLTMFGQSFSVAVSGTGLNDTPVLTSPASLTAELGLAVALSGANSVGVTDAFGTAMQVTLTTTDGTLSVPIAGVTVTGNGSASVTITGTPTAVNAALAGLTVTYTEVGARTIDIAASDQTFATVLTDTATIAVTVVDTTPPVITVPGASVLANSEPGKAGAHVTFTVIVVDRGSAPAANPGLTQAAAPTFTCSPSSGSFFPIGTTTVTCTAQDSVGNTSSASFSVIVSDTEKPTITPPATQRATLPRGATTIAVTYPVPTAADNSGQVTVTCVPASGSAFAAGTTTVTCTATDPSGNTATASFSVVVTAGALPPTGGGNSFVPAALATLLAGALLVLAADRRRRHLA